MSITTMASDVADTRTIINVASPYLQWPVMCRYTYYYKRCLSIAAMASDVADTRTIIYLACPYLQWPVIWQIHVLL